MCLDGTRGCNIIEMAHTTKEGNVLRPFRNHTSHVDKVVRETEIEIVALINLHDILGCELKTEGVDIGFKIGHLVAADYGEHVWGLGWELVWLKYVRKRFRLVPCATRMQARRQ